MDQTPAAVRLPRGRASCLGEEARWFGRDGIRGRFQARSPAGRPLPTVLANLHSRSFSSRPSTTRSKGSRCRRASHANGRCKRPRSCMSRALPLPSRRMERCRVRASRGVFQSRRARCNRLPRPGGKGEGIGVLIAVGLLEHFDVGPVDSARFYHLQIEAMKLAFADLHAHVADPAAMTVRPEALLDPAYLAERARLIDPHRASMPTAGLPKSGGTVYLTAAYASGMMVSFIQSNYRGFGSGVVVPGTGIALHSRGEN